MRLPGVVVAVVALVLAAPSALAQQGADQHRLIFESAEVRFLEPINATRIVETNEAPTDGNCNQDLITRREDGTGFTFDESQRPAGAATLPTGRTGCAEALYDMTFPVASTIRVSFTADRRIDDPTASGVPALQEFRLHLPDGERREELFEARARSMPPRHYERVYALPPGTANITLGWFFQDTGVAQDTGLLQPSDPGALSFAADVYNVTIEVRGMPVAADPIDPATPEVENETAAQADLWYNFTLPPAMFASGRQVTVLLNLRSGPDLMGAEGPRGEVPLEALQVNETDDTLLLTIGPQAVQGAGDYSLRFRSVRVLPPPQLRPDPTTIEPFYYTIMLLPAPAALLALYSGIVYRREAEGRYRRPATGILVLVAVGIAYYLLLVLYAMVGVGKRRMTTLELAPEATLVYIQLIVLLLFFIVTAVVVGRYLAGAMRKDIEQRRLQEEKLRRSNEELERFAYVASHDLQEPLRKVAGFTSLLQRRYKGRLDKDADEMIQYAVDGATRMQALIRDILAYSRVGSSELDVKDVEVASVLELVVADLGERIKEERAQVSWDAMPTLQADPGQLRQVLQNLVENAIKYRHPSRRPKVRVTAERDGAMWCFAVADNGVGIPADKLSEVFGIFRRLHGSNVPGTGIGLALAKKAVERHGGKIWVESRLGRGSTFYFTLPAMAGAAAPAGLSWRTPAGLRGSPGTEPQPT